MTTATPTANDTASPGTDLELIERTADEIARALAADEIVLVDVREPFERAAASIEGSIAMPLDQLDGDALRARAGDRPVVFHCRSGKRSADAAARFARAGERVHHLAGGIEAWKSAGHPVARSAHAPRIDVMRQVQMTAGSLVLIGVVLGTTVSPWFLGISAFVGAGLVFAGASGWCGMAKLLAVMPWNATRA